MGIFDIVTSTTDVIIKGALAPIDDAVDILDGLSEGEIRTKAAARLGADVVAGMALSEVIDALKDTE